MHLGNIFQIAGPLWGFAEVGLAIATRGKRSAGTPKDRGSVFALWAGIVVGLWLCLATPFPHAARIADDPLWPGVAGLILLADGLALRAVAIVTLGRYFNPNVTIQHGYRIVRRGLYRYLRHPSYTGMMMAFTGLGVARNNWLCLLGLMLPIGVALLYRIHVEEQALAAAFGADYDDYSRTTKRLIPGVY